MAELMFGREKECQLLEKYLTTDRSEFVAVYGRRRVGKTFLLRKVLGERTCFSITGMVGVTIQEQLQNFNIEMRRHQQDAELCRNWLQAFGQLSEYLEKAKSKEKIIFIDELPWFDTPKSNFVSALEHFWNSWASARSDVKLFVCGSAASWMLDNIINNRGGLHNRVTHQMLLEPFSLAECKQYFENLGYGYGDKEIAEFYMVFGGIPYYMSLMNKEESVVQNIDRLIFSKTGELRNEKNNLFRSLFRNYDDYLSIINTLSSKSRGMTRSELVEISHLNNNSLFTTRLVELENCNFIRHYESYNGYKRQIVWQLIDPLCHFWCKVVEKNQFYDEHFWAHSANTPIFNSWNGLAFEILCLNHISQIKQALGISGVQTRVFSWIAPKEADRGAQIDLIIDRADNCVNLCEMKFYRGQYEIGKAERESLENKVNQFVMYAEPRKSIRLTMISSYGIKHNTHSAIIQNELTLRELMLD